jgi:hypothetical protein
MTNTTETTIEARNAALEEAASLVEAHKGEIFCGIGGNMGWRAASQDLLAKDIRALKTPVDDATPEPNPEDTEGRAMKALAGLRDAVKAGMTLKEGAPRVLLSDGSFLEGAGAADWHALMNSIVDLADKALAPVIPWRAYPGASWPDEPVEADHVGSFATLEEAQDECDRHRRGGFGDFVIHETTREVWKRSAGSEWILITPPHTGSPQ